MPTADVANAERFERIGAVADARTAGRMRDELAEWLRQFFTLDPTRLSDIVLAVNEALANCAEFAYAGAAQVGTMDVRAEYDRSRWTMAIVVADRGSWRRPDTPSQLSRGRGIPLMKALSDRTTIDASDTGTHVRLEWTRVESARVG